MARGGARARPRGAAPARATFRGGPAGATRAARSGRRSGDLGDARERGQRVLRARWDRSAGGDPSAVLEALAQVLGTTIGGTANTVDEVQRQTEIAALRMQQSTNDTFVSSRRHVTYLSGGSLLKDCDFLQKIGSWLPEFHSRPFLVVVFASPGPSAPAGLGLTTDMWTRYAVRASFAARRDADASSTAACYAADAGFRVTHQRRCSSVPSARSRPYPARRAHLYR